MMELEDLAIVVEPKQVDDFLQTLEDQGAHVLDVHSWPRLVRFEHYTPWEAEIISVTVEVIYHLDDD